jgi:hypothetical protein
MITVDAALRGRGELTAPVELLSTVVMDHLAHEETRCASAH